MWRNEGNICKKFGYDGKMGGYTTLMSDIPKLYAIAGDGKDIYKIRRMNNIKGGL